MSKFKLAFGIHNHQPVGNFEAVFEEAHRRAYFPFLKLVSDQKTFRMSLHQSGILWEWQKKNHPEYFELVKKMVKRGQIEILSGGFYEPILCAIPNRDVIGQIELLNEYVAENFGTKPSGLWLTERVWEPHLPELLSQSGVKFLAVDDAHFIYAGFNPEKLREPFVTESNGDVVTLLPIQKRLRYLIPFGTIEELITELKKQADKNPSGLAVYADDGEKFGIWPDTFKHCYEDGWIESFFEAINKNSDWLEIIPLGEAAQRKPAGRAYLPTASYSEMLQWSLPADAFVEYEQFENWLKDSGQFERYGRFVRGGHWRNFLFKYDESNLMHKKMIHISKRLENAVKQLPDNSEQIAEIRHNLYAAQCNCPYWHGVFGGIYLPHIRQAVYSELLQAEDKLNRLDNHSDFRINQFDFDCDGFDEVTASNNHYSAVFKPSHGGSLIELSLLKQHFNLTDTLSRRREGYHHKLELASQKQEQNKTASIHDIVKSKEENLHNLLIHDWYLKRCFVDHIFGDDITFEKFQKNEFKEDGDFVLEPYAADIDKKQNKITLTREGTVWREESPIKVKVTKSFEFVNEQLKVRYQLQSDSKKVKAIRFAVENNFTFQAGHAEDRYLVVDSNRSENSYLDSLGNYPDSNCFAMIDEYRQLAVGIESDQSHVLWHLPIFTVSLSESGFEKVYQGTTFVQLFEIKISKTPVSIEFDLFAGSLENLPEKLCQKSSVSASG